MRPINTTHCLKERLRRIAEDYQGKPWILVATGSMPSGVKIRHAQSQVVGFRRRTLIFKLARDSQQRRFQGCAFDLRHDLLAAVG